MENYRQQQEQEEHQQWLVYEKLQKARVCLQEQDLKKSGHNKFANYKYFELSDFLPTINMIFADLKLCHTIEFYEDMAYLRVIDTENGGHAKFSCPMAEAQLKGCHPVQNLGAAITYITRYLLVMALAIVEHDAIEPLEQNVGTDKEKKSAKPITKDVFDSMQKDEKEMILSFAMQVTSLTNDGDIEGALQYINSLELDADWKTALWSQLTSSQRSAIKKLTVNKEEYATR
jgi:hypothetical protein